MGNRARRSWFWTWTGWKEWFQRPGPLTILNMALNEVHEAIYLIDSEAKFIYVNDEAVRALGYSRDELLRMVVPDIDPGFPLDRWRETWAAIEADIPTATTDAPLETIHRTKDGRGIPVEITSSYIRQAGKTYAMALARDISERRRAERQQAAHVRFLESIDRINLAIQKAGDLEQMMSDALDIALELFECDRAFMFYPCELAASAYRVPMERTRPEFPGAAASGAEILHDADVDRVLGAALGAAGPVRYGPGMEQALPALAEERFGVKSMLAMAIYPRVGAPWLFGLQQCSRARVWTHDDEQLFDKIGSRLSDAFTSLLAHRDLRQSEWRLKEAQRIAHMGDWELDLTSGELTSSDELYRILELDPSRGPVSMEVFRKYTHPDDLPFVDRAYTRTLEPGKAGDFVYRVLLKDGRVKYVQSRWTNTYDPNGNPVTSIGVMLDITRRKEAEMLSNGQARVLELVASGATLEKSLSAVARLVEDQAPGVLASIMLTDGEGASFKVGAAPSLPAEYRTAMDGATVDLHTAGPCGASALSRESVYEEDVTGDVRWGGYRTLAQEHGLRACWSTPICDARRKVLGVFAMHCRQPARPKPVHIRLLHLASHIAAIAISRHSAEAALRLSEERYRSMVVATATIVWTSGPDGKVFEDNPSWRNFTGQSLEDMRGEGWLEAFHPEDREGMLAVRRSVLEIPKPFQFSGRVRRADGQYRYVTVVGVPVLEKDGKVREWIGTCTDITDRERARMESESYRRHLEAEIAERQRAEAALFQAQKMEAIGRLTGGVAHDFNNLLTAITGNLDLLRRRAPEDAALQRYARNALSAVERASSITSQLLAFSRSQRLEPRAIDVNEAATGMIGMLRQTVGERIGIALELAPRPWLAMADRRQLETALLNLVINARDAMEEGGVITIRTANVDLSGGADRRAAEWGGGPELAPGRYIALTVSDTGRGVEPAVARRIFEPFVTTKEVGKGTGLGLSMVYGFAQQSGGGVGFETEVGRGSAFTIYLPQTEARAETERTESPPEPSALSGGATILVVEDEAQVREVATAALSSFGYDVVEAADGVEALEILERRPDIQLVFTDVVMPRGNGVELARTIRERWPHLGILLTTGYARGPVESSLPAGLEILPKPYRADDLGEKARALLGVDDKPKE